MGEANIKNVHMNKDSSMNTVSLKSILEECLIKKIPILAILAVVGST
jgi:hypothetical protein